MGSHVCVDHFSNQLIGKIKTYKPPVLLRTLGSTTPFLQTLLTMRQSAFVPYGLLLCLASAINNGLSAEVESVFREPLGPKWDHEADDGELIDDASRFGGDKELSKQNYEDGMARSFRSCHAALRPDGRLVVVFANKQPDAWETFGSRSDSVRIVVHGSWYPDWMVTRTVRGLAAVILRLDRLQEASSCSSRLG